MAGTSAAAASLGLSLTHALHCVWNWPGEKLVPNTGDALCVLSVSVLQLVQQLVGLAQSKNPFMHRVHSSPAMLLIGAIVL
jgi:hypothetical protein